jgi:hypothetical protein
LVVVRTACPQQHNVAGDAGEDAEEDPFAERSREETLTSLARRRGFFSEAAADWALRKFGGLVPAGAGLKFQVSGKQEQLLQATTVVAAVQSLDGKIPADLGATLVQSLKPLTQLQVRVQRASAAYCETYFNVCASVCVCTRATSERRLQRRKVLCDCG